MHFLFMRLKRTQEYLTWYKLQRPKEKAQIVKRLTNIEVYDHFGDHKDLTGFLHELRWSNGRRIYYSSVEDTDGEIVLLILGGNKNGQSADISKARKLLSKYSRE